MRSLSVILLNNSCHNKANAIGRSSKTVREFLEKNHKDDMTRDESIKLTVKSLLEVVQTGAKNIEISVMEGYGKVTVSVCNITSTFTSLILAIRT
jgi:20S proteasome alpha/beta subunit